MNEVVTINTTTLANKDLRKHLNEIKKAVETIGAIAGKSLTRYAILQKTTNIRKILKLTRHWQKLLA